MTVAQSNHLIQSYSEQVQGLTIGGIWVRDINLTEAGQPMCSTFHVTGPTKKFRSTFIKAQNFFASHPFLLLLNHGSVPGSPLLLRESKVDCCAAR